MLSSLGKKMVGSSKQAEQSFPLCLSASSTDFLCLFLFAPGFYLIAAHWSLWVILASLQWLPRRRIYTVLPAHSRQDNNFQGPCPIKSDLLEINYCARSLA